MSDWTGKTPDDLWSFIAKEALISSGGSDDERRSNSAAWFAKWANKLGPDHGVHGANLLSTDSLAAAAKWVDQHTAGEIQQIKEHISSRQSYQGYLLAAIDTVTRPDGTLSPQGKKCVPTPNSVPLGSAVSSPDPETTMDWQTQFEQHLLPTHLATVVLPEARRHISDIREKAVIHRLRHLAMLIRTRGTPEWEYAQPKIADMNSALLKDASRAFASKLKAVHAKTDRIEKAQAQKAALITRVTADAAEMIEHPPAVLEDEPGPMPRSPPPSTDGASEQEAPHDSEPAVLNRRRVRPRRV